MGSASNNIAAAMDLRGAAAVKHWREMAKCLTHLGKDPNRRSLPPILDQLPCWRMTPGRTRKARTASLVRMAAN